MAPNKAIPRHGSPGNGSAVVRRVVDRLLHDRGPSWERTEFLRRAHAELLPFTIGVDSRARELAECAEQIQRVISSSELG